MTSYPIKQEDRTLIRSFVLCDYVYRVFERDRKVLASTLKTPDPYLAVIDQALSRLNTDLKDYRAKMRNSGIKILEEFFADEMFTAKFLCRGYNDTFQMRSSFLAVEGAELMKRYLGAGEAI
jgi:hypothetical protein